VSIQAFTCLYFAGLTSPPARGGVHKGSDTGGARKETPRGLGNREAIGEHSEILGKLTTCLVGLTEVLTEPKPASTSDATGFNWEPILCALKQPCVAAWGSVEIKSWLTKSGLANTKADAIARVVDSGARLHVLASLLSRCKHEDDILQRLQSSFAKCGDDVDFLDHATLLEALRSFTGPQL
jgi:hypothetical protein